MVYHLTHFSHPLLYGKKLPKGRRCHLLLSEDAGEDDTEEDDDEKDDAGEDSMIGGVGDSSH